MQCAMACAGPAPWQVQRVLWLREHAKLCCLSVCASEHARVTCTQHTPMHMHIRTGRFHLSRSSSIIRVFRLGLKEGIRGRMDDSEPQSNTSRSPNSGYCAGVRSLRMHACRCTRATICIETHKACHTICPLHMSTCGMLSRGIHGCDRHIRIVQSAHIHKKRGRPMDEEKHIFKPAKCVA